MKTLNNHSLIYDTDCPLCVGYTNVFTNYNLIDEKGKKPFSKLTEEDKEIIDMHKASNEIALINTKTKEVIYGVESLLTIIGNSFPIISKIGNLKPINYILQKCYKLISYNRKVIITVKQTKHSCIPDFNIKYRWTYIIFCSLISSLILNQYSSLLTSFITDTTFIRELIMCSGQILFQGIIIYTLVKKDSLNYLGNMISISFFGSLALIPILFINNFISVPELFNIIYFGFVVCLMILEHKRRVSFLTLPIYLTFTWVIYRLLWIPILLIH